MCLIEMYSRIRHFTHVSFPGYVSFPRRVSSSQTERDTCAAPSCVANSVVLVITPSVIVLRVLIMSVSVTPIFLTAAWMEVPHYAS